MAPDSRFWRHQLGEASHCGWERILLLATLPVFLLFTVLTSQSMAKTEPVDGSCNVVLASNAVHHTTLHENHTGVAIFSLSPVVSPTSPAGRWSSRIQMHIPDEPAIQRYIRHFESEGRQTMLQALERSKPYLSIMTEILESHGVPAELIAVIIVESCFDREAKCKGAVGYWQLMATTARKLGLRVDRWVDERMDPVRSTEAAAKYLRLFYDEYQSWPLALAAYNAGDGKLERAFKKSRSSDFWELVRRGRLPRRTGAYVPKVFAAAKILKNLEAHGFQYLSSTPVYDFETVTVKSPLKLEEIARWISVPVNTMQELNPSLRLDVLPPDCDVNLNLPSGARDKFDLAYDLHLRR
ncbi:MAG: lytic transglycosylase domain-containing protein [Syntrophobacteraceae bacterium]|nr:lytic transglycosylase domain-containing protein [Syntrophobacteraceae bacterium]